MSRPNVTPIRALVGEIRQAAGKEGKEPTMISRGVYCPLCNSEYTTEDPADPVALLAGMKSILYRRVLEEIAEHGEEPSAGRAREALKAEEVLI